jgi:glyoxylase-like metal-dependent hydrolase (beta-lactamase superfamily II)
MRQLRIGDVTISSIIERDGPWRTPESMFPAYDAERAKNYLADMDPEVFDPNTGKLVITYQTFVVQTPKHTMLVDTCTGEDKGYEAPMDFDKTPWCDGFDKLGLKLADIDYVFCTHLHIDHCGWNTTLKNGRWMPTFPKAKYVFHKREYAAWEALHRSEPDDRRARVWKMNCEPVVEAGQALLVDDDYSLDDTVWLTPTPGHSPCHCCVNIRSCGQRAVVTGDMMHHALQCRAPEWSTVFDSDPKQAEDSRRGFLSRVADTSTLLLPIHFPSPTVGRVAADGSNAFHWRYVR